MLTRLRSLTIALLSFPVLDASASVLYVDLNSPNPMPPYTNWGTAATNIQDAVDAATTGDTVLVTNGVYATGGQNWYGSGTNRVTLTNAVTLQSVNGPAVTWIVGNRVAGTGAALANAVRCVAIGSRSVLSGFTLTNGEAGTGNYPNGGGAMQASSISASGTVTNCVLAGNLATNSVGGGAYRVILINCLITGNSAGSGGGACACTLINCTVVSNTAASGGGVFGGSVYGPCVLTNCLLTGNSATGSGGGAYGGALTNCVVVSNTASTYGGGAYGGVLNNCVITGNSAGSRGGGTYTATMNNCTVVTNSSSQQGGGVDEGQTFQNCIIYYNSASFGPNINGGGAFTNCCTTPIPAFGGNDFTNAPLFLNQNSGDFHLQSNSPCINSGNNASVSTTTDLDGNPRIRGGTVDIGAYEFQNPASVISYAWLQRYGLPTDGTADLVDLDHDGMNNWQEWVAGTNPTNALSVLNLLSPSNTVSGATIRWQSVSGRTYYLQRATNLLPASFSSIQSNIAGQAGTTSFTDNNATGAGPYFYRVGVQQ